MAYCFFRNACCLLFLTFASIAMIGCKPGVRLPENFPSQTATLERHIDLLRTGDFATLKSEMDESLVRPDIDRVLGEMQVQFPEEAPISIKVVDVRAFRNEREFHTDITLEYQFSKSWLVAEESLRQVNGESRVKSLHVAPMALSLEQANSFSYGGRNWTQWMVLLLGAAGTCVSLYALVKCLQSGMRKKWLWALLCLVGLGRITMDWTSGVTSFQVFWIEAPPFSASAQPYSPWMFSASLPVFAIWRLLSSRRNKAEAADQGSSVSP